MLFHGRNYTIMIFIRSTLRPLKSTDRTLVKSTGPCMQMDQRTIAFIDTAIEWRTRIHAVEGFVKVIWAKVGQFETHPPWFCLRA